VRPIVGHSPLLLGVLGVALGCGATPAESLAAPAPVSADSVARPAPEAHAEPEAEVPTLGPVETARRFFGAIAASDVFAALALVAPERRAQIMETEESRDFWWQAWSAYQCEVTGEVELEEAGTRARVTVNHVRRGIADSSGVRFDLIDGRWYLNEN